MLDIDGSDRRASYRELLRLLMPCDPSAPRLARQALGSLTPIAPVRDAVLLVASELISNAVMHAGCEPAEEIELVVQMDSDTVRLAISDRGRSDRTPTVRGPGYRGPGGLGLHVVEGLARRWGSERQMGTVVWAELSLEAQAGAGTAGR